MADGSDKENWKIDPTCANAHDQYSKGTQVLVNIASVRPRYLATSIVFPLLILIVPFLILNAMGFCFQDWRFHTSKEIIYDLVKAEITYDKTGVLKDIHSPEEFLERNRNCCSVSWDSSQELNWLFLLFGAGRWQVDINYDYQREGKSHYLSITYPIGCCGKALKRYTEGS
jgi:hypothetical protein